jgi:hypothetical protein
MFVSRTVRGLIGIAIFSLGLSASAQVPTPPSQSQQTAVASPLAPIAWMSGTWAAEAKQPGSEKSAKILSRFTPQLDGRTMSIEASFDGKAVYQGMFAYDPALKAIAFWYVTPDGESIRGTADTKEPDDPLFDFRMTLANGVELHFQTKVHRVDTDHYSWTLFTTSSGGATWQKLFAVDYHRVS